MTENFEVKFTTATWAFKGSNSIRLYNLTCQFILSLIVRQQLVLQWFNESHTVEM